MKTHLRSFQILCRAVLGSSLVPTSKPPTVNRKRETGNAAFTIIELLAVISIIGILVGMVGSAAYAARQKAYRAQAEAEVREIANACRSYWMASGSWKGGSRWPKSGDEGSNWIPISKGGNGKIIYDAFTGENPSKTVFLKFDEQRFAGDAGEYCDPWGNPYEVKFDSSKVVERKQKFSSSVTFPMRYRYEYYGNQFQ